MIKQQLPPHEKDLGGGFMVRRLLPAAAQRAVGPFVFLDHFGPVTAGPGDNHDVRPHPHIGLATVTYLFEGTMVHRDSTGAEQTIEPGAINWMTSGRGIVHSERTPEALRGTMRVSHGLQLWVGLPEAHEEDEPSFVHVDAAAIPVAESGGATVRVLVGEAFGQRSPVAALSPTLYLDVLLPPGGAVELGAAPSATFERAIYPVDRAIQVDGVEVPAFTLAVIDAAGPARIEAPQGGRCAVIGGEPIGPRFMWWNFVSSRKARIEQAADDWAAMRLGRVAGDDEFIPLPPRPGRA